MIPLGVLASSHVTPAPAEVSAYRAAVLADSPYAYYPLDDASTPTDVTGNTTPDLVAGVTLGVAGIGDGTTAALFDGGGSGRGIRIPSASLPSAPDIWTVEMLVKATNLSTTRALTARTGMTIIRHSTSVLQSFFGVVNRGITPTPSFNTNIHHVALVVDVYNPIAPSTFVYLDGTLVASDSTDQAVSSSSPLYIGSRDSGNVTFLGTMAGYAFHTTALPGARILAHAQAAGVA